jgi:NAD(P)-dependent dehydrogenase (short-subunit alcohol dehydrogenase family)
MELLSNVHALANELLASNVNISLLVNNAGRFLDEHFTVTKEGIEHTIALDYFGERFNGFNRTKHWVLRAAGWWLLLLSSKVCC